MSLKYGEISAAAQPDFHIMAASYFKVVTIKMQLEDRHSFVAIPNPDPSHKRRDWKPRSPIFVQLKDQRSMPIPLCPKLLQEMSITLVFSIIREGGRHIAIKLCALPPPKTAHRFYDAARLMRERDRRFSKLMWQIGRVLFLAFVVLEIHIPARPGYNQYPLPPDLAAWEAATTGLLFIITQGRTDFSRRRHSWPASGKSSPLKSKV